VLFSACGEHHKTEEVLAPNEVLDFGALFSANCAGCHGENGNGGAAIALANPVYLAIADDHTIRNVIAKGVSGTAMPAFAANAGGLLTDQQIDVIAQQIRARWSKPGVLDGANPEYAAKSAGDPVRGHAAYQTFCE
jgi:cytochrome c oxidase cbb3-type subunit 3/ubiquinol-cytochrome c reductase cytochrome c subunit